MSWRDHARPIIARVLAENAGKSEKEIRAALREAYPFGERAMHPYKIWLSEIAFQLGKKKFGGRQKGDVAQPKSSEGQQELFPISGIDSPTAK